MIDLLEDGDKIQIQHNQADTKHENNSERTLAKYY